MTADEFAWQGSALCAQIDPDLWHLSPQMGGRYTETKQWCHRCPVIRACAAYAIRLEWGLTTSERRGMFGGMTAKERVKAEQRIRGEVAA